MKKHTALPAMMMALLLLALCVAGCDDTSSAPIPEPAVGSDEGAVAVASEEGQEQPSATEQEHVDLDLDGMTCVSCAATIESTLQEADGVLTADVDFGERRAHVEFDASKLDHTDLIDLVDEAGFQAQVVD